MCYILKSRLLVALAPGRFAQMELECQELAASIMLLRKNLTNNQAGRLVSSFYMAQSTWIAKGIIETKTAWNRAFEEQDGIIEKWKFEAWCQAVGRDVR